MTKISVRYHMETGAYYLQVAGENYRRADKRKRYLSKALSRNKMPEKTARLRSEFRRACSAQSAALYYVAIPRADIPEGASIRPLYHLPEHLRELDPQQYQALLATLKQKIISSNAQAEHLPGPQEFKYQENRSEIKEEFI